MTTRAPAHRRSDYYPKWPDNLADEVTLEGAAMNGTARGAETVHSIIVQARTLYEFQDFHYAGNYGDNGFLEDYTSEVQGHCINVIVSVIRNDAGKTEHVVVNHRPRSALLVFSHLMHEKFAGTPIAEHFLADES